MMTAVTGLPEIVRGATTVIENAASATVDCPSLTRIWTLANVPTLADVGVPVSCPVRVLKLAQSGMLAIEKVRASPSGSEAVGVKL
jgi:hypothetical protein